MFYRSIIVICLCFFAQNSIFSQGYDIIIGNSFIDSFYGSTPFSRVKIMDAVQELPELAKAKIMKEANRIVSKRYSAVITTETYDLYDKEGNRAAYEEVNNQKLNEIKVLILAELIRHDNKYILRIKRLCNEFIQRDYWIMSAHLNKVDRNDKSSINTPKYVDIGAADIAEVLSWTVFFFEKEMGSMSQQLSAMITNRVISPFAQHQMHWMELDYNNKLNNWNPWINYKVLLSLVLLKETIPREIVTQSLNKSAKLMKFFLSNYNNDGYCDEGPVYWQHSILNCIKYLDLIRNISSKADFSKDRKLLRATHYITKMYISGDYYVNYGDTSPRTFFIPVDLYTASQYFGNDKKLMEFSYFVANRTELVESPLRGTLTQCLNSILTYDKFVERKTGDLEFERGIYYEDGEVVVGRTYPNNKGFFFSAKGGGNGENHNHNDVGNFILYYQGLPVIIDMGKESYTKKSFSDKRYSIHSISSYFHNVPRINNVNQHNGSNFNAKNTNFKTSENALTFSMDISNAYSNRSEIDYWKRTFELSYSSSKLIVTDEFSLRSKGKESCLVLMCYNKPIIKDHTIELTNSKGTPITLSYNKNIFKCTTKEISISDEEMSKNWGKKTLYKLILQYKNSDKKGNSTLVFTGK